VDRLDGRHDQAQRAHDAPQRDVYREVSKILEDNGQLPDSYWWKFMRDTYGQTQAIAVRRQRDTYRDVASLGRLLTELQEDASLVTPGFWLGLWNIDDDDEYERRYAARQWAETYGGSVGDHLDPAIPTADFDALTAAAADVKNWVDRHVAHADASAVPASVTLTLQDIHDAIDVIGELFQRYYTLFTAASMIKLVPVIQHNWKAVFPAQTRRSLARPACDPTAASRRSGPGGWRRTSLADCQIRPRGLASAALSKRIDPEPVPDVRLVMPLSIELDRRRVEASVDVASADG